jgi:hypothetical protein
MKNRRLISLVLILVFIVEMSGYGFVTAQYPGEEEGENMTWSDNFDRNDSETVGNGWVALRGGWEISQSALQSTYAPADRVIAQTGFELGRTFTIETTLRNTAYSRWNGVAFNIADNGDGTQNFYAFRMVTYADERPAAWQLLQVSQSAIGGPSVITRGEIPVEINKDYTIRISSPSYGLVNFAVLDGDTEMLSQSQIVPLENLLAGGYAGFYSNNGSLRVDKVNIVNSVDPAAPSPGPLQCTPFEGQPYVLPEVQQAVYGKSIVDTTWAGHPVGQSLVTHGNDQYVVYYNADRQMVVAQREIDSDTWVKQPLDTFIGWDSHNYVTMAVDRDGHLHVSGNMHNVPLIYFRTTTPGDVTSVVRVPTMVDSATEQKVTYPVFLHGPSGELIFRHRDGMSGSGADLYNIYSETTQQWQRLLDQPLHDGEGLRNAYVYGPTLGPDGYYHITWVWRDTPDAATNQRLSYARSPDLVNWEKSDGTPLQLPITYSTGEVVDPVPMNGGILNGMTKIGFDAQDRVLISYHKYDNDRNTQIYLARLENNGEWTIKQVSDWEGSWTVSGKGSLNAQVNVSSVSVLPDGKLRLDFTCSGTPQRTWILNEGIEPIAEVNTPRQPNEFRVRSEFPGMRTKLANDQGFSGSETVRYVLKWETLPPNQDKPRNPPLPEAVPLEVYELRR